MRLVFATEDFKVHGRTLKGFPLLLNDDGELEPAFHGFMLYLITEELTANSPLTWDAYGWRLYDYFMFLQANGLAWDEQPQHVAATPLRRYRDWSVGHLGLNKRTVNARLGLVVRFYTWAKSTGQIEKLPFKTVETRVSRPAPMLAHLQSNPMTGHKTDVKLREFETPMRILSPDQIAVCRETQLNKSHKLLFELMLRTGLRTVEARTFPTIYVPDVQRAVHTVSCSPDDMHLKYAKHRIIHVPGTLMNELRAYRDLERNIYCEPDGSGPSSLIVSSRGMTFARTTVISMFDSLSSRVGFKVEAHMLRHSYATYTLRALRRSQHFKGDPLLYVRDRMGHADVQTTVKYLHLLDQLEGELALAHENYIDRLFDAVEIPNA